MAQRVVIDPVTRIEGHLKVEVVVEDGVVTNAWVVGTAARGFEILLKGKDPRDATYVTERICGVCAGSHGWNSSIAVENAQGAQLPEAGRVLRNLMIGAMWLHDHPLHFYHLSALDYLDVMAVAEYTGNDPKLLAVKDKIVGLVKQGDTAPLTPRYEPDEFCVNDPEVVITAVAHYLQALEMQAKARKMSAIFAGKQPHQSSIVAGGVTMKPNAEQILRFKSMLQEQIKFMKDVYVPDVIAFGTGPLLPLAQAGVGGGEGNFLSYGGFPLKDGKYLYQPGVIFDGNLANVQKLDQSKIIEDVKYSWLQDEQSRHPADMDTVFNLNKKDAYSFLKAPRYQGRGMEVGPLARMLVQQPQGFMDIVTKYDIKIGAVARHAARAYETLMLCDAMEEWVDELIPLLAGKNVRIHDTEHWSPPKAGKGQGLLDAPRGALGHWIEIQDAKIKNYQMVVPTTWNFSPRDEGGKVGPLEAALLGVPVPDLENPINIVRVVRSYDPCLSCAVHLIEPDSNKIMEYKIC
ncbi:MAG: nickel-dependent hydrogenase large subunit [Clostridia bacterium]|nr:nickel-dependent hydrogenase large subunit [Clostridia bacterium]